MKKIIIVCLLCCVGCSSERMGAGFRGASTGFNQAMQYDIQLRQAQPMQIYPLYPPQQIYPSPYAPNYWQEERARQQWWDNQYRKMGVTPH